MAETMNSRLVSYCERLWREWMADTLELSPFIESEFQTKYLPEPYLGFGAGKKPLYVLTTNPGRGMSHQHRKAILSNKSFVLPEDTYQELMPKLADFYRTGLKGTARRRIDGMIELAQQAGYDGLLQMESCPFHSKDLPKKKKLLSCYDEEEFFQQYAGLVKETLRSVNVIGLSAVGTRKSISMKRVARRPWIVWQAAVMSFDLQRARLLPLVKKGTKVTSAFVYQRTRRFTKGLVLVMGGNHLPSAKHCKRIADVLKR